MCKGRRVNMKKRLRKDVRERGRKRVRRTERERERESVVERSEGINCKVCLKFLFDGNLFVAFDVIVVCYTLEFGGNL